MGMSIPTFVVGTGRCGSTMLSNMLREHPKVLSLSEFFSMITDGNFSQEPFLPGPLGGKQFWSLLSAIPPFYSFFLAHRMHFPEVLYRCDTPSSQYSRSSGVPAILLTTLPHLSDQPDALFQSLAGEVATWPAAATAQQYKRLFGWLMLQFGKSMWVERSGTLLYIDALRSLFPEARFVHMVRDGRDAALSSQKHNAWRLGLAWGMIEESLGVHPLYSSDRRQLDRLPSELRPFLPEQFDADRFETFEVPLPTCGAYWAFQMAGGLKVLGDQPPDGLLTLCYEDFLIDPKRQLDTLAAFLGEEFVDEDWSARCAATVRPPRSTWRDLPEDEARALTEACRPGFEALAAAGMNYEFSKADLGGEIDHA